MVLKPGWLNRQFDQVSRDVEAWPAWMKRAAGFASDALPSPVARAVDGEIRQERECELGVQGNLNLK